MNEWTKKLMQMLGDFSAAFLLVSAPSEPWLRRTNRSRLYVQMQHFSFQAFNAFITSLRWVYTYNCNTSLPGPTNDTSHWGTSAIISRDSWLIWVTRPQDISNKEQLHSSILPPSPPSCYPPQPVRISECPQGVSRSLVTLGLAARKLVLGTSSLAFRDLVK